MIVDVAEAGPDAPTQGPTRNILAILGADGGASEVSTGGTNANAPATTGQAPIPPPEANQNTPATTGTEETTQNPPVVTGQAPIPRPNANQEPPATTGQTQTTQAVLTNICSLCGDSGGLDELQCVKNGGIDVSCGDFGTFFATEGVAEGSERCLNF